MTSPLPRTLSLLCLVCLASVVQAEDQAVPIRDDAGMFHAGAIDRAEQRIADIRRTFDRNLFVRTVASASPRPRRWFPFLRTPQVNRMLEEQARKYADESGVRGIYVVICNRPHDVHIIVRPEEDTEFTRQDAETLRRTLARSLHDKGGDAALLALVDQVQAVLQDHATRGPSSVVNDVVLASLLGGGLVLWLLLRMVRFKIRAGSVSDRRTRARETPALLGAMFGCPAGLWIYDKLYPCPSGAASPLCEPSAEPAPAADEENSARIEGEDHPVREHTEDAPVSP